VGHRLAAGGDRVKAYAIVSEKRASQEVDAIMRWRIAKGGPAWAAEFGAELAEAMALISRFPEIASMAPAGKRGTFSKTIRRFLLNRTGYCFSYRVNHADQVIMIRRIWPQRGRPPRM
jgi:plasmid stabilization system protein ParE